MIEKTGSESISPTTPKTRSITRLIPRWRGLSRFDSTSSPSRPSRLCAVTAVPPSQFNSEINNSRLRPKDCSSTSRVLRSAEVSSGTRIAMRIPNERSRSRLAVNDPASITETLTSSGSCGLSVLVPFTMITGVRPNG